MSDEAAAASQGWYGCVEEMQTVRRTCYVAILSLGFRVDTRLAFNVLPCDGSRGQRIFGHNLAQSHMRMPRNLPRNRCDFVSSRVAKMSRSEGAKQGRREIPHNLDANPRASRMKCFPPWQETALAAPSLWPRSATSHGDACVRSNLRQSYHRHRCEQT